MNYSDVILIMDLDGTLLASKGEQSYLTKENEKLINQFIAEGGTFSIATGRSTQNGFEPVKHLPLNFPLHLINGALTLDHHDFFTKHETLYLDQHFFLEAIEHFKHDKAVSLVVVNDEGVHGLSHDGIVKSDHGFYYNPIKLEDLPQTAIYKIAFIAEKEHCDYLEDKLMTFKNAITTDLVRSLPRYLEALNLNANKGYAIRNTMKRLNLEHKTLVCVGDQMNDASMLATADLALVPNNANPKLKSMYQTLQKSHNETILEDILSIIKAL